MPIYARKKEGEYTVAPEGLWAAVCVDVIDLGLIKTAFGEMPKIQIRWQLEERDEKTDRRHLVVQNYTPSLHEKSKLRPMLEAWRGRKFTKDEEKEFDIEKLLGANCQLQIVHNIKEEGRVFANVQAVVPPAKGSTKLRGENYIRVIERAQQAVNGNGHGEANEDWTPF